MREEGCGGLAYDHRGIYSSDLYHTGFGILDSIASSLTLIAYLRFSGSWHGLYTLASLEEHLLSCHTQGSLSDNPVGRACFPPRPAILRPSGCIASFLPSNPLDVAALVHHLNRAHEEEPVTTLGRHKSFQAKSLASNCAWFRTA